MHTYSTIYHINYATEKKISKIANLAGFATGFEISKMGRKRVGTFGQNVPPPYVFEK